MPQKRPKILRARKGIDLKLWEEKVHLLTSKDTFANFFPCLGLPDTPYKSWMEFKESDRKRFGIEEEDVTGAYCYRHELSGIRVVIRSHPELKRHIALRLLQKVYRQGELTNTLFALHKPEFTEVWLALSIPANKKLEVRALPIDIVKPKGSILETLYDTHEAMKQFLDTNKSFTGFEILKILWTKFNRAPVTENFYADLVAQSERIEHETRIPAERDRRRFSLLLLTRLMFTYFLQKKDWIEGKEEILNELLQVAEEEGKTAFYDKYLKALFFNVLNELPAKRKGYAAIFKTTPYLNGGLFSESEFERKYSAVTLPNGIFNDLFENLLDKYRFIVTEETPEFTTVSVDPEILGGVFEKIIQGKERKEEGAYYTPKEVCLFMVRNALFFWLRRKVKVEEDRLLRLIFDDDPSGIPEGDKATLLPLIKSLKIVDPAVGSGAFLQGMLLELERLRKQLGEKKSDLERRLEIIRDNLYGVDIDDIAVWLCELRLWLNLVDVTDLKDIPPLPNLDHKIIKGDSLLQEVMNLRGYLPPRDLVTEMEKLEAKYLQGGEGARKIAEEIKEKRRELVNWYIQNYSLKKGDDELGFHWEIDFPGVFTQGGFDIAIMNPPYVRQEDIGKHELFNQDYKRNLLQHYQTPGQSDLYVYFYQRLKDLLKDDGVAVMVTSNSWLDVDYGKDLQRFIINNFDLPVSYESEEERWFGSAVNTDIFILERKRAENKRLSNFVAFRGSLRDYIITGDKRLSLMMQDILDQKGEQIGPGLLYEDTDFRVYRLEKELLLKDAKWGKFLRAPKVFWKILERGKDKLVPLKEIAEVRFGIKTGANEFFYVKDVTDFVDDKFLQEEFGYTRKELTQEGLRMVEAGDSSRHLIEAAYLKPVIKSPREIEGIIVDPTKLKYKVLMVHETKSKLKGKKVLDYIQWGEKQGYHKRPTCKSRQRWWDLGKQLRQDFIVLRFRDQRNWTPLVPECCDAAIGDVVFVGKAAIPGATLPLLGAILNSTFFIITTEIFGRINLGDGLLTTYGPEICKFPVVNPKATPFPTDRLLHTMNKVSQRAVLPIFYEVTQPDRRELDLLILEALGFTDPKEREEVLQELYEAVTTLVRRRLEKARTVMGTEEE